MAEQQKITYAGAGVDIDAADHAKDLIRKYARTTATPRVLSDIGFFNGLFEIKGYRQPVLVSSVDGVGTKLKIATALDKHDTIGMDLVNHCVNDILPSRAEPLFFLDYIGVGKLFPQQAADIVKGLSQACKAVGCALIGGETAEMPGIYARGDYDLVGFIVGVVEKDNIPEIGLIRAGDAVIGLPSNGLHTNGYSLVRRILDLDGRRSILDVFYPELGSTLGEALLRTHRCYYQELRPLFPLIKGMAHITGGGLPGNVPRTLPAGLSVHIDKGAWRIPPLFELIQRRGDIDDPEMYRVFNMGIGMALIVSPSVVDSLIAALPEARLIGEVIPGDGRVVIG